MNKINLDEIDMTSSVKATARFVRIGDGVILWGDVSGVVSNIVISSSLGVYKITFLGGDIHLGFLDDKLRIFRPKRK